MNLTDKQIEIMKVVSAAMPVAADLDQILERLSYRTSKASLQFSLRALERHELIDRAESENRRGRVRRLIAPTAAGIAVVNGTGRPAPGPGAPIESQTSAPRVRPQTPEIGDDLLPPAEDYLPELTFSEMELDLPEPEGFELEVIDS
jgi:hypothetical protein